MAIFADEDIVSFEIPMDEHDPMAALLQFLCQRQSLFKISHRFKAMGRDWREQVVVEFSGVRKGPITWPGTRELRRQGPIGEQMTRRLGGFHERIEDMHVFNYPSHGSSAICG